MSEPIQSTDPAIWKRMRDGEVADIERRVATGRMSDMIDMRRYEVLRLIAEVRRRRNPFYRVIEWAREQLP